MGDKSFFLNILSSEIFNLLSSYSSAFFSSGNELRELEIEE
jgi:hypothetical protein